MFEGAYGPLVNDSKRCNLTDFFFLDRVSLCFSGTNCIDQIGLKFIDIYLFLPLITGIKGMSHHA